MTERSFSSSILETPGRRQGLRFSFASLFVTLLLAQSIVLVTPQSETEIVDLEFNMILDASSLQMHYVKGFLQAPASIDLSNIRWITNQDEGDQEEEEEEQPAPMTPSRDNEADGNAGNTGGDITSKEQDGGEGEKPEENAAETSTSATASDNFFFDEFGGIRTLRGTSSEASTATNQILDVALFLRPPDCETDSRGECDWVALGVGAYDDWQVEGISYCCSKDTASRGICNSEDIGTILINRKIFKGDHRNIKVPSQPFEEFQLDDPIFDVQESGDHTLVIANCNDDGLSIMTIGYMKWTHVVEQSHGHMIGLMFFFSATIAIYVVLGVCYYCGMIIFQEAAIPIQKYILCAIMLGFLETAVRGIDLYYWNITGMRSPVAIDIALALGALFQGCLRCLGVMVAMGWGVVRDTLGMTLLGKIILLGLLYFGFSLLRDSLEAAASSVEMNYDTAFYENLAEVLYFVIISINIIFYYWIIISVKSTAEYLRSKNQTSKLRRHLRLRCLIVTSLIICSTSTVIDALQFLSEDQTWITDAVGYGNYLFILIGVTILWRPNARAKDYAMQMQLSAVSDDANDLEVSCVVPSADDMDTGKGYKIDNAVVT